MASGGARPGAGRKKVKDKVVIVTVPLRKSRLKKLGGQKKIRKIIEEINDDAI